DLESHPWSPARARPLSGPPRSRATPETHHDNPRARSLPPHEARIRHRGWDLVKDAIVLDPFATGLEVPVVSPDVRGSTISEVLEHRARVAPDRTAFIVAHDGTRPDETLTYAGLDRRARTLAAVLRARTPRGARALLVYPSGLEYIAALF